MVSGLEILCASKNYAGNIIRIGGDGWSLEAREAIVKILNGQLRLNIRVDGIYLDVGLRGEGFDTYLVIEPDGFPLHNLSDLPSC